MASGTVRYGLTDRLTLEAHAEGGGGLLNGGAGAVFGLGPYGVGTLAGAASSFEGEAGFLVAASVEAAVGDIYLLARTQRTFGDYNDIASVTYDPSDLAPGTRFLGSRPPRALDQVSVSVPLRIDPATLNFSYTHLETADRERSQILGLSLNRPFGKTGSLYATAFTDLERRDSFGIFAGLSIQLDGGINASTGVSYDKAGVSVTTTVAKPETAQVGSFGWRVRDTEGAVVNRAASVSYRAPFARFETGVQQFEDHFRATAQVDGAVVLAGGGIFLSNRIDDAFAVIDTGAPDVEVEVENRPAGRTNRSGKLLVPNLRSYEPNQISIDPTNLPVDAQVGGTREVSVPADRSGAVVRFAVETGSGTALVTLRDENGDYLETGATGELEGGADPFVVGYDGQAFVVGLGPRNRVTVDQPTRGRCIAEFTFEPRKGEQVSIPDAVCRSAP